MTPRPVVAVACAAVMCCASRAHAQSSADRFPLIEWSVARPLTANDFKGKIPLQQALPEACRTAGASAGLKAAIDGLEHKWQDEQSRYDRETSHGTNPASQSAWAAKTAAALREPRTQGGALPGRRSGR